MYEINSTLSLHTLMNRNYFSMEKSKKKKKKKKKKRKKKKLLRYA
jgi:hypothetical protein